MQKSVINADSNHLITTDSNQLIDSDKQLDIDALHAPCCELPVKCETAIFPMGEVLIICLDFICILLVC